MTNGKNTEEFLEVTVHMDKKVSHDLRSMKLKDYKCKKHGTHKDIMPMMIENNPKAICCICYSDFIINNIGKMEEVR